MKPRITPAAVLHGKSEAKDQVSADGLRYVSKQSGSPCSALGAGTFVMRSCFFCGLHRGPSQRRTQKVVGKTQLVCDPPCGPNPLAKKISRALDGRGQ